MGCGSSHPDVKGEGEQTNNNAETEKVAELKQAKAKLVDSKCNSAMDAYLSAILRIEPGSADVTRYVIALRSVGCDTPEDLGELTVDELAWEPFNFKRLHVTKVRSSCLQDCVRIRAWSVFMCGYMFTSGDIHY